MKCKILLIFGLFGFVAIALAQDSPRFEQRDGYEEFLVYEKDIEIPTRNGKERVTVSIRKLRMLGGEVVSKIQLPEKGLVILQHRAGDIDAAIDNEKFSPLEGEWIRVELPNEVVFQTEDDTALVDAIFVTH